jgi:hypothetical protein
LGDQGFDICLQAGAATGVVAGETEDNGAGAVDIHGRRAYHQTYFGEAPRVSIVQGVARDGTVISPVNGVLELFSQNNSDLIAITDGYARVHK